MLCPILTIPSMLDPRENSPCECQKETCAWWVDESQNMKLADIDKKVGCAIKLLAEKR